MHLFVILTDPDGPRREVILVSISSVRPGRQYDDTCIVEKGEHEFIKRRSFVSYKSCRQRSATDLERGVKNGRFIDKGCINAELFARIIDGVPRSKFTPRFVNEHV
ncbi:MAG: hypothetical protein OD817_06265 [Gammaproteobacteria bacterium]